MEITELKLAMMDQDSMAYLRSYLECQLQCRFTYMSEGYYLVRFPAKTIEVVCTEPDPRYQQESILKLPNGVTLRKVRHWPCVKPGCTHTSLFLADEPEEKNGRKKHGIRRNNKQQAD